MVPARARSPGSGRNDRMCAAQKAGLAVTERKNVNPSWRAAYWSPVGGFRCGRWPRWRGGRRRARAPWRPCGPGPGRCPCPAGTPPSCARRRTAGCRASGLPPGRRSPRRGPGGTARRRPGRGRGSRAGSRPGWPGPGPARRPARRSWPRWRGRSRSSSPAGPPSAAASRPGTDRRTGCRSSARTPGSPARSPTRAGPPPAPGGRPAPRSRTRPGVPAVPVPAPGLAGRARARRRGPAGTSRRPAATAGCHHHHGCSPPDACSAERWRARQSIGLAGLRPRSSPAAGTARSAGPCRCGAVRCPGRASRFR